MSDPRYRSYQQTVKDSTTREYQNKSTNDSLRAKIRNMRSDHSNETGTLKATVKSLNEQRAGAVQSLANKTTELANVQDVQDAALKALRSQVSKSDSKVAEHQRALEMANASNEKPDQHKTKIAQLEATIAELNPRIPTLTSRNASLDEALSYKQNEPLAVRDSQKTYIASLEAERDTLQHHLRHVVLKEELLAPGWAEASVAQWKAKVSKLEEDLAASKAANARLAQDSKKLEQYKIKLSPLEASNKTLKTDNSTLARDLSLKSNELSLIQTSNSTRITSVESELSNSVAGLSALLSKNSLLEDRIVEQEKRIRELLKGEVRGEKGERGRELRELREALGEAKEALREVKGELREMKEQFGMASAELGQAKEELGEAKEEARQSGEKLKKEVLKRNEVETVAVQMMRAAPRPWFATYTAPRPSFATHAYSPALAALRYDPGTRHSIPTPTPAHAALVQHSDFVFKQFVKTIKDLNEANTTLRNSNTSLLMRLVGVNA